jgi:hypothetical protein
MHMAEGSFGGRQLHASTSPYFLILQGRIFILEFQEYILLHVFCFTDLMQSTN